MKAHWLLVSAVLVGGQALAQELPEDLPRPEVQDGTCAPYIANENEFVDDCAGIEPLNNWGYTQQVFNFDARPAYPTGYVTFERLDTSLTRRYISDDDRAAAPFYRSAQWLPALQAACITAGYQMSTNTPPEGEEGNADYTHARAFAAKHCVLATS